MRQILSLMIAVAVGLAACADDGGLSGETLPVADGTQTTSQPADTGEPIPTEPNGGIGDGATGEDLPVISPGLSGEIELALGDLAERLTGDRVIEVLAAHEVTWPNGALGCPQEGMMYTQSLVDGYRIELSDGEADYQYHGATGEAAFLCDSEFVRQSADG